jgi:hypothetical protein
MRAATLVFKALILGALLAATAWAISRAPGDPTETYIQAVVDKQRRLESLGPGKVVLIGGSNTAFSVDSRVLEQRLRRPVVNMGVHAELGLRLMLAQVRPFVARGDVIVLSPEYQLLFRKPALSSIACRAVSYLPRASGITRIERARCELVAWVEQVQSRFTFNAKRRLGIPRATDDVFTRAAFNEYGDLESHLGRASASRIAFAPLLETLNEETLDILADFGAEAERRGACVYLVYPAFADFAYAQSPDAVAEVDAALRRRLPHAAFLGPPGDFLLPRSHLFDTVYHANAAGRAVHTQRIADGIAGTGGCR